MIKKILVIAATVLLALPAAASSYPHTTNLNDYQRRYGAPTETLTNSDGDKIYKFKHKSGCQSAIIINKGAVIAEAIMSTRESPLVKEGDIPQYEYLNTNKPNLVSAEEDNNVTNFVFEYPNKSYLILTVHKNDRAIVRAIYIHAKKTPA